MKDIHGDRPIPRRIPVISPTLHCVAMTALVYLRSSFGITLFRPRTIFFAFSVAVSLLDYIAWHEPEYWQEYHAACIFSAGAVALYWIHFGITIIRELLRNSEADDYSGTSHALRVMKLFGIGSHVTEMNIHLWMEPALVAIVAAMLRYKFDEHYLSQWLVIVAMCMFAKEMMNYWTEIRREKIAKDITTDAMKQGKALGSATPTAEAPKAARVSAQTMPRKVVLTPEEERAVRFAEVLGIAEPYDLEEAEERFRELIRLHHPDTHNNSPESNRRTAELNEAIEFFREKLGG